MYVEYCDDEIEVYIDDDDICTDCIDLTRCPLIGSLQKGYVHVNCGGINIESCPMYCSINVGIFKLPDISTFLKKIKEKEDS